MYSSKNDSRLRTKPFAGVEPEPEERHSTTVRHPSHYTANESGIECIEVAETFSFNLGSAIKYIWRAGVKTVNPIEDLEKARQYLDFEIARLKRLEA